MRVADRDPTKGILNFSSALEHFALYRLAPGPEVQSWIEGYWVVEWDLPPGQRHRQTNLSHASINVALEPQGAFLYGVPGRTFIRTIRGTGRVFGIKFRPGAFFPFYGRSVDGLTGKVVPLSQVFRDAGDAWAQAMVEAPSDQVRAKLSDSFLREMRDSSSTRLPDHPSLATLTAERIMTDRSILKVAAAALAAGVDVRTLQRIFQREVGISPKEVIRRFRLQESAQRLAADPALSCGDLALQMGYYDQAHFIRDFKAVVGMPPDAYRRRQLDGHG